MEWEDIWSQKSREQTGDWRVRTISLIICFITVLWHHCSLSWVLDACSNGWGSVCNEKTTCVFLWLKNDAHDFTPTARIQLAGGAAFWADSAGLSRDNRRRSCGLSVVKRGRRLFLKDTTLNDKMSNATLSPPGCVSISCRKLLKYIFNDRFHCWCWYEPLQIRYMTCSRPLWCEDKSNFKFVIQI